MKKTFSTLLVTFLLLNACATKKNSEAVAPLALSENPIWETSVNIDTPESVYFNPETNTIYVSNVSGDPTKKDNLGWISALDKSGKKINYRWAKELHAPKGMRASQDCLWVSDINRIHCLDSKTGRTSVSFLIPGSSFLNDVVIDEKTQTGYVSDTVEGKIYLFSTKKTKAPIKELKLPPEIKSPNGLLIDGDILYVATWGEKESKESWNTTTLGGIYALSLKDGTLVKTIASNVGNLDGLEKFKGHYLVTDWMAGKLLLVSSEGTTYLLKDGFKGSADIGIVDNLVMIPRMQENLISTFELVEKK